MAYLISELSSVSSSFSAPRVVLKRPFLELRTAVATAAAPASAKMSVVAVRRVEGMMGLW